MNNKIDKDSIRSILATDCGSTTTKAILIEKGPEGFRLRARGEAPTTVEAPAEDVTQGVRNAIAELSELIGRPLLDENDQLIKPYDGKKGVDIYLSTSSAGGGLQMMVAGVVAKMSSESAQRAALGAGAVVMETLSSNDSRRPYASFVPIWSCFLVASMVVCKNTWWKWLNFLAPPIRVRA